MKTVDFKGENFTDALIDEFSDEVGKVNRGGVWMNDSIFAQWMESGTRKPMFGSFPVLVDPKVSPATVELRDQHGSVVAKIVNIGEAKVNG